MKRFLLIIMFILVICGASFAGGNIQYFKDFKTVELYDNNYFLFCDLGDSWHYGELVLNTSITDKIFVSYSREFSSFGIDNDLFGLGFKLNKYFTLINYNKENEYQGTILYQRFGRNFIINGVYDYMKRNRAYTLQIKRKLKSFDIGMEYSNTNPDRLSVFVGIEL